MAVSLELLTDDAILDYTRSDGKDHVLSDFHDLNLQKTGIAPYPKGIYDVDIFGSPFENRCLCPGGAGIHHPQPEPCPNCGARVLTNEEALRRFARIELPFYYLNDLRFETFVEVFNDIFKDCKIVKDFEGNDFVNGGYSADRGSKKFGIKTFDTCQFEYDPSTKELTISEFITDESKCSYEGLLDIIKKHFPSRYNDFRQLVNHYYLVLPARMRPFTVSMGKKTQNGTGGNSKKLHIHEMSIWYTVILRLCCPLCHDDAYSNYDDVMKSFSTPGERVRYTAVLRAMLNLGKKKSTDLLNSSKKNYAREMISVRTQNSARCPIVPSTTLAIDEIGVPQHLAYEMCREGFVKYLMNELNFTRREALKTTIDEYDNPETKKMFKEYAEKQIVLESWYA